MKTNKETRHNPKWMSSGYLQSQPAGDIDREKGIIEGVKICTEGEAKGHGVSLDSEFIETVVEFGNSKKQGLKARFGHPNMCSTALGTFLGRHKNFRIETSVRDDGRKAQTAVADLFLSNEAKDTPNGNLYEYVLGLAENEADMFGTSIVFTPGRYYRKTTKGKKVYHQWQTDENGECLCRSDGTRMFKWIDDDGKEVNPSKEEIVQRDYVECDALHACDCVDDPAANDGLFSQFAQDSIAGQLTEFLDLHPLLWNAMTENPAIIEAVFQYGDNVDEFIRRYSEYRQKQEKSKMATENLATSPAEKSPDGLESEGTPEDVVTNPPAGEEGGDTNAPPETGGGEGLASSEPAPEPRTIDATEFAAMVTEFGAEIASRVAIDGGGRAEALQFKVEALEKAKAELEAQVSKFGTGGNPAKPSQEPTAKKGSIWAK